MPDFSEPTDAFWKSAFGRDPHIIGKAISFNSDSYEVIGVMAAGIQTDDIEPPDVWVPFPIAANSDNQVHYFQSAGRLKSGVTLDRANAQLQLMTQEFRREYPNTVSAKRGDSYSVQRMRDVLVRDVRLSLLALAAAVVFVLLIACSNMANLLLMRAAGRTREMSIRMAAGGTRGRIIRQLLTESVLLSMFAALFGLGLGLAGVHFLIALIPSKIPRNRRSGCKRKPRLACPFVHRLDRSGHWSALWSGPRTPGVPCRSEQWFERRWRWHGPWISSEQGSVDACNQ